MTDPSAETRSVVVEREMAFPAEKIWRALTQPHLIEQWLMKTDFEAGLGKRFALMGDWGRVDCQVLELEPNRTLVYSWAAMGLESVVTWTLTQTPGGTLLRMEQSGFRSDQTQAFNGAKFGWRKFFAGLEHTLGTLD